MTERMTDERLDILRRSHVPDSPENCWTCELLHGLQAERTYTQKLEAEIAVLKAECANAGNYGLALEKAEATVARIEPLVEKWKDGDFNLPDYTRGKMDGRHECTKELQAALNQEEQP